MIVDDDQHLVLGLTARLKASGYQVTVARDAISALTVARKESPDLVILDLGLPAGDGFMVLERMRALSDLVATPVIVLSARNPADNKQRALDFCASAYFQKPPDSREFMRAVRNALGETISVSNLVPG
jgi:DNA-binding response OmpR family regulator